MALWHNGQKTQFVAKYPDVYLLFNNHEVISPCITTISVGECYSESDYWIGMGHPEKYDMDLLPQHSKKIFRRYFERQNVPPGSYFADVAQPKNGIVDIFRLKNMNVYFAWFHHSLGVALHFCVWMGVKRIHFVGIQAMGYEHTLERAFINEFARLADYYGIDCVSCTKKSSLNGFMDYRPVDEALDISIESVDISIGKSVNLYQTCPT